MRYLFFLILTWACWLSVPAQVVMKGYAAAMSGLNLRKMPDPSSEILDKIPYGTPLQLENNRSILYSAEGINGHWVLTAFNGKKGYVFDGYLLPYPPPTESSLNDYLDHRFNKIYGPAYFEPDSISDTEMQEAVTYTIYENGISRTEYAGFEYYSNVINIPYISMQQAFLLCRLLPDLHRFIPENAHFPLQESGSETRKVIHKYNNCDKSSYLENIRIELTGEGFQFLEIGYGSGGIRISTGGGN